MSGNPGTSLRSLEDQYQQSCPGNEVDKIASATAAEADLCANYEYQSDLYLTAIPCNLRRHK